MIQQAADAGCDAVLLPECLDLGWTWPEARKLADPIPGERSDQLAAAAYENGIWVVAGLTERDADKVFNCAVLISSDGQVMAKHRKINELAIAHPLYDVGDRIAAVSSPFGLLGVTICADNFPESLVFGHALARMGVQTLLSPCAWAVDADHDNSKEPYGDLWLTAYRRLASLYDMNIVGVSCVGWLTGGPWKGRKCVGNSMAVGPGGRILAVAPHGVDAECLTVVELVTAAPIARGADFANALKVRGYTGP
jgi:predicted amidohydrolase